MRPSNFVPTLCTATIQNNSKTLYILCKIRTLKKNNPPSEAALTN